MHSVGCRLVFIFIARRSASAVYGVVRPSFCPTKVGVLVKWLDSPVVLLQEIKLTTNGSLAAAFNQAFNDCDNNGSTVSSIDCAQPQSFPRHPVGALATFDHVYTAPGRYWVTVFAYRLVPVANVSDTVLSNISVAVFARASLANETGLVFLLVPSSTYVDEPLTVVLLIENHVAGLVVTAECDDDAAERRCVNVVEISSKSTLQDVIESRYRIAARSGPPPSTNVDELATTQTYFRRDVTVQVFRRAGVRHITVTVVVYNRSIGSRFC